MLRKDMFSGIIVPLKTTVFNASEVEKAFRYLASGKHMGKVIVKLREHEFCEETLPIARNPMIYCKPNLTYIILGGLGGFGLELSDWLILRGCKKLLLSSSKGISKPYQQYRINLWRSYGVEIVVSTSDIRTPEGCLDLVKTATKLGSVGGIFNLAVQLRDNIFENQDAEKFYESLSVKAYATKYLDEISKKFCPLLEHFVVFSSVSCGRGNAGQTNYGMANSIMERIIEARVAAGYPGKAIQWGAVGEVGLVAQMAENKIDMEIGGTLQQRISSCLQVLDILFSCPHPIVGSMVVAEKKSHGGSGIIDTVMNIIGIKDAKSLPTDQKLSEVGMDSLMAVEIKQTLERDFELVLSPQDLRNLTLQSLIDMTNKKPVESGDTSNEVKSTALALLFRNFVDEEYSSELIVKLNTKQDSDQIAIILPGFEGVAGKVWYDLSSKLNFPAVIIQYKNAGSASTIEEIVDSMLDQIVQEVLNNGKTFSIIGYSFGAILAICLANKLENLGMKGKILLIEGSPLYLKNSVVQTLSPNQNPDAQIQFYFALLAMSYIAPNKPQDDLIKCKFYDEMIDYILNEAIDLPFSKQHVRSMMHSMIKHPTMTYYLDVENFFKVKSNITLITASEPMMFDIDEDYGLSRLTSGEVKLKCVEGNHMTILDNDNLAEVLNEQF